MASLESDRPAMDNAELKHRFRHLHEKAKALGLKDKDLCRLSSLKDIYQANKRPNSLISFARRSLQIVTCFCVLMVFVWCLEWPVSNEDMVVMIFRFSGIPKEEVVKEPCIVNPIEELADIFRPPVESCDFCKNVQEVERIGKLSPREFEERYAYSGIPVVVIDAMENWTATEEFNFNFFKNVYADDSPVLENVAANCQFFPYKTSFKNLREVFEMDEERANMKDGSKPWYIGWSNCDSSAGNILRKHYERPYFLPHVAESSKTDWVFMGSPGYGAHLHIDNVRNPSWQAQVRGMKKWKLEPPPECYAECNSYVDVNVNPGDIIVLDTNRWFHSTLNVGQDISICIGSEYD